MLITYSTVNDSTIDLRNLLMNNLWDSEDNFTNSQKTVWKALENKQLINSWSQQQIMYSYRYDDIS